LVLFAFGKAVLLRELLANQMINMGVRGPVAEGRVAVLLLQLGLVAQVGQHGPIGRSQRMLRIDQGHLLEHRVRLVVPLRVDVLIDHHQERANVVGVQLERRLQGRCGLVSVTFSKGACQAIVRVRIARVELDRLRESLSGQGIIVLR
jgi:hypothetical protein